MSRPSSATLVSASQPTSSTRRHPSATLSNNLSPSSRDAFRLQASRLQTLRNPERAWTTCHQVLHGHHVDGSKQSERNMHTNQRGTCTYEMVFSAAYLRSAEPTPTPLAEFDYDGAYQPSRGLGGVCSLGPAFPTSRTHTHMHQSGEQ